VDLAHRDLFAGQRGGSAGAARHVGLDARGPEEGPIVVGGQFDEKDQYRVLRGGCFDYDLTYARASHRSMATQNDTDGIWGFRCAGD